MDTPGFGVDLREEELAIDNLVNFLQHELKYVNAFVIAFKQQDNRMSKSLRSMIGLFQKMFGDAFWENAILEATHWNYGERVCIFIWLIAAFHFSRNADFKCQVALLHSIWRQSLSSS